MTIAVVALFVGTALASGDESKKSSRVGIVPVKNETFNLIYGGADESGVKIEIVDMQGHTIRTDKIKSNGGFMKPYNFAKVEEGTYTIKITDKFGETTKEVEVGSKDITNSLAAK